MYPIRLLCGLWSIKSEFVLIIGSEIGWGQIIINIKFVHYLQPKIFKCWEIQQLQSHDPMNCDVEQNVANEEVRWPRNKEVDMNQAWLTWNRKFSGPHKWKTRSWSCGMPKNVYSTSLPSCNKEHHHSFHPYVLFHVVCSGCCYVSSSFQLDHSWSQKISGLVD